jgi:hypothetical protein
MALIVGHFLTSILQRNLNNAFAYDLVPSPGVCIAALKAARRVNDYPTAVRVFEGMKLGMGREQDYDTDASDQGSEQRLRTPTSTKNISKS